MTAEASSKCPQCGKSFPSSVRICPDDGTVLEHDTQAAQLGAVLDGKYRLDAFLSRGGMGAVYKATHVMLGKTVAVKLINPELVTSPDVVRRFQREARAAATVLSHPNIVSVFDLGQTSDGTLYIAMEFVDGRSLKAAIAAGGPMAPDRAIAIMRQVARGLSAAHRNKIVHRDLKPQNIMLTRDEAGHEIAKLVDFGIAKTFDDATQLTLAGDAIGTPHYMAPEQAAGQPVDARTDIYSAGIILYEMLSGSVPFNDASAPAILVKHLQEIPQPPSPRNPNPAMAAPLDAIVLKCLEKDPARRFQTADELDAALDSAAAIPASALHSQPTVPMPAAAPAAHSAEATIPMSAASPRPTVSAPAQSPVLAAPVPAPAAPETVRGPAAPGARQPGAAAADTRPTVAAANAASSRAAADAAGASVPASSKSSKKPLAIVAALFVIAVGAAAMLQMRQNGSGGAQPATVAESAPAPAAGAAPAGASTGSEAPPASPAMASGASSASPATASDAGASAPAPGTSATPQQAPPATSTSSGAATRGHTADSAAASAQTAGASAASASTAPPAAAPPAAAPPAAAPQTGPPAAGRPSAQAAAGFPEKPAVAFECAGAPEICAPLRTAMDDALEKAGYPNTRNPARADVSVTASANAVQGQVNRQFGTTFTVMNYSIEVAGEAARTGEVVPMPPSRQLSFDQQFGSQRATEAARLLASDIVDKVKAFAAKKH